MTKYNTGNPVGSADPRDLYDNAENLDNFVNGDQAAYNDRLGKSRKSWQGMEDEFAAFIASSGYEFVGEYAADIEITGYNQVVRDGAGELWRVSGSTELPYTTTGAGLPEGGSFVAVGDAVLRQELNSSTAGQGTDLIAHTGTSDTVTEALDKRTIYVGTVAERDLLTGLADGAQVNVAENGFTYEYSSGSGAFTLTTNGFGFSATSLSDLKSKPTGGGYQCSLLGLRAGLFEFDESDLSAEVSSDTQEGVFVAPASDPTGASGAWVRQLSGRITPEMFGASVSGTASENHAALSGMFSFHNASGIPVDLGSNVYEVDDTLTFVWTISPIIHGKGATIKLVRAPGAEVAQVVFFQCENLGYDLKGWGVDADDMAYNGIWIENTADTFDSSAVKDFFCEDLFSVNVRRAGSAFTGGRGISVRGSFRKATLIRPVVKGVKLAAGAGIYTVVGVKGLYVGRGPAGVNCPMHTVIKEPYIENVYSEDPDYQHDQDGLALFAPIPTGNSKRSKNTWRVEDPTFKNCWGRGIKVQAQNVVINRPTFERNAGFWTGNKGICEIDFQFGEGTVRDISCAYAGGWASTVVLTTARDYAAGTVLVDGAEIVGTSTLPSLDSIVLRWSDTGHLPCAVVVKNITTSFCASGCGVDYFSRFSSSTSSYRRDHLVVENMNLAVAPTALVLLKGVGQTTLIMAYKNSNLSAASTPLVSASGATADLIQIGGAVTNLGFT